MFGFPIFERSAFGVTLTGQGEAFYRQTQAIPLIYESAVNSARSVGWSRRTVRNADCCYADTRLCGELVPTGIPGVKLGLSNSVLILAISWLGIPAAFALMFAKVLLSGLLFSGVGAMLYALAGGLFSMTAMCLLYCAGNFRLVTTAIAGAVLHNVGQVTMAMLILRTDGLVWYMGVLMLVGLAACGAEKKESKDDWSRW